MLNSSDLAAAGDIDGPSYLKTIIAVASADGEVHEKEREFINVQAQVLSLNSEDYWRHSEHDLGFLSGVEMSRPTCMTILRDCIVLGHSGWRFHRNGTNQGLRRGVAARQEQIRGGCH